MATFSDIAHARLINQHIADPDPASLEETVLHMGMVQAQDYYGALWAVGLRTPGSTQDGVEQALAEGRILRTWPARGTLHFVAPQDVRWLLDLLARRNIAHTGGRYRQLELNEAIFDRARDWTLRALQGGNRLTRDEIYAGWQADGISPAEQRGIHMLGRLAQEGLICFGPRRGKQPTFVLLDEWVPGGISPSGDAWLSGEQALAELARRYFTSHGPASVKDFAWWSGLSLTEARQAVQLAEGGLEALEAGGVTYWTGARSPAKQSSTTPVAAFPTVVLLPGFDEYLLGYVDRRAVLDPQMARRINAGGGMLSPAIVVDGLVAGTWKRVLKKNRVEIIPAWFEPPAAAQIAPYREAVSRYAAFLGLQAEQ